MLNLKPPRSPPDTAGWSDQLLRIRVASDALGEPAVSGGVHRDTVDGVLPVRRQIERFRILVDSEVIEHSARHDQLGLANGFMGLWIDLHAHEQLLGRGVHQRHGRSSA
jgi:hypothetical protein